MKFIIKNSNFKQFWLIKYLVENLYISYPTNRSTSIDITIIVITGEGIDNHNNNKGHSGGCELE